MMHIRWAPLSGALWEKGWLTHCKMMISPFFGTFLSGKQKDFFSGRLLGGCFILGGPGPGPRDFTLGQLSIEFVNVGGWLTSGDLAFDSCAQFLAVA